MDKENIQLKCMLNIPISITEDIQIKAKTLNEIIEIGYLEYNRLLGIFNLSTNDILELTGKQMTLYEYICGLALDKNISGYILTALNYFIDKYILVHPNKIMYYIKEEGNEIIYEDTFDKIILAIKYQNSLISDEDDDSGNENPASEKARQLLEKRKIVREKLKKAKQKSGDDEEPLTLLELISVMSCNCQGLNIFSIGNLNLFQFNDQFNRMVLLDNYRVNIRALLAGANKDELGMENWMKKIH